MYAGLRHLQLAMPPGEESGARAFYAGVLGLDEIVKPPALAGRGGAWFRSGLLELHLGVQAPFHRQQRVIRESSSRIWTTSSTGSGPPTGRSLPTTSSGFRRVYTADVFGNRLEFLQDCSIT